MEKVKCLLEKLGKNKKKKKNKKKCFGKMIPLGAGGDVGKGVAGKILL